MNARDETVHTHGCLSCRPDMAPGVTRDDSRCCSDAVGS